MQMKTNGQVPFCTLPILEKRAFFLVKKGYNIAFWMQKRKNRKTSMAYQWKAKRTISNGNANMESTSIAPMKST
ncbi:MAG: hypothetical protein ACK438_01005 [Flavobacteriales bacterium]